MKAVAFVPVRLTSTRLPEKHFKLIGDKPLLSWVIKRLRDCKEIDQIVVCAPNEPESIKLLDFCEKEKIELYVHPGDVNDVVGRLTTAAKIYGADICVLASGDCPLLSSASIDKIVDYLRSHPDVDMASIAPKNNEVLPIHEGFNAVRRHVWELAEKYSDTPELREHQFPVLKVYEDKFSNLRRAEIIDDDVYYEVDHRISVDTPDDLEFMNVMYDKLRSKGKNFELNNVIKLLRDHPELMEINKNVHQKGLNDKSKKVLFVVSAVKNFGYGNLMRAVDVALSVVDMGVGVEFAVLDEKASHEVESKGFKYIIIDSFDAIHGFSDKFDGVLFDIHKDIVITEDLISRLKRSEKRIVFIDNAKGGASLADKVIIPTAHYYGEEYSNLLHGAEFVVIRSEIKKLKKENVVKKGGVIRVDKKFKKEAKRLWPSFKVITRFSNDFTEELLHASVAVLNLGVSCYEALYLDTMPIIVPRSEEEVAEIEKFYGFVLSHRSEWGEGSLRIAEIVEELLR